jgi:hypothetical protein
MNGTRIRNIAGRARIGNKSVVPRAFVIEAPGVTCPVQSSPAIVAHGLYTGVTQLNQASNNGQVASFTGNVQCGRDLPR